MDDPDEEPTISDEVQKYAVLGAIVVAVVFVHVALIAVLVDVIFGVSLFDASIHNPALAFGVMGGAIIGGGGFVARRFGFALALDYAIHRLSARKGVLIALGGVMLLLYLPTLVAAGKRLFDF